MRRSIRALALGTGVAGAALGLAARTAAPAPAGPAVTVASLEGAPVPGTLAKIGPDGVRLEGRDAALPLERIREIAFAARAFPVEAAGTGPRLRVALRGGETIRGVFAGGSTDWLEVEAPDVPRVRLPFDSVLRIEAESARKGPCDDPAQTFLPRPGNDVAYTKNADAFTGTWIAASPAGVVLESAGKSTTVAWADLVVLHVDEPPLPRPDRLVAEVETLLGTRLLASEVTGDAERLAVKTRSGLELSLPVASVLAVRWSGGAFVYASDLDLKSTFTSWHDDGLVSADFYERFFGMAVDRTRLGCPLRVAGTTYRHGIAVNARSRVEVPLAKGYVRFECRLGVDDSTLAADEDKRGDLTARVLVDGREAWSSQGSVKSGEAARVVGPVDVAGASTIVLEVDFGAGLHVNDRADWVDPILVRAGAPPPSK